MGRPKKITPIVEKAPARLPGSFEVLPEQMLSLDFFLEKLTSLAHTFGYAKIEMPLVEDIKLFRFWESAGGDNLVAFADSKGTNVALKPTNLFSLARCYLEYHYPEREKVSKWFYLSPVATVREGQIKQSTEYGFQIFGETNPIADSQLINLIFRLFNEIGLGGHLLLEVNNIGCLECQPAYE